MFKERDDTGITAPPKTAKVVQETDDPELLLSHLARYHLFQAGETLFKEGDRGAEAFIIKSGKVHVVNQKTGVLGDLGPGQMVGEMAIISDNSRVATATAKEETLCIALSRKAMKRMLGSIDMETHAIIEFLVDYIDTQLEGNVTDEEQEEARRSHRILEILLENPDTKTKLALQEPFFKLLCNSLLDRARASLS